MKKVVIAAVAAGLMITGSAMAQTVFSVNVVGFQKIQVPPGGFAFSSTPFLSDTNDINSVIGEQGTDTGSNNGDVIFTFDGSYSSFTRLPLVGPPPNLAGKWVNSSFGLATNEIPPGTGFVFQNNQSTTQEVVVVGEVVDLGGPGNDLTREIPNGLNLVAYPWSSDIELNASNLTNDSVVAQEDNIFVFDVENQSYATLTYFGNLGPGNEAISYKWLTSSFGVADVTFTTGTSFFYLNKNPGTILWTEDQPYNLQQ